MHVTDPHCGPCVTLKQPNGEVIQFDHQFPRGLRHHYSLPSLDASSIPVYRGPIDHDGKRFRGVISVHLGPRPHLRAHAIRLVDINEVRDLMAGLGQREPAKWVEPAILSIDKGGKVPRAAKTSRPPTMKAQQGLVRCTFEHVQRVETGDPNELDSVTFFIINGWFSEDGLNTCYEGNVRRGRLEVTLGDWQLRIEPRGDISAKVLRDHQHATGSSTVTHIGRLRRDDGASFSAPDAVRLLDIIQTLTDFAVGRVSAIVLPVGWQGASAKWSACECDRAIDRPLGPAPFLDPTISVAQLGELYQRGYEMSDNTLRWAVFKSALGYYLAAENEVTANLMVMLPVSALQVLSFAHLVEELAPTDPNSLSARKWKDLSTEDQLRRLLSVVGVELEPPPHMMHLNAVAKALVADRKALSAANRGDIDALSCAVKLRNEVAHPKRKQADRWTGLEWAETGFFMTEMLHLAMLWWLRYNERYLPRTAEFRAPGDAVSVPWRTQATC